MLPINHENLDQCYNCNFVTQLYCATKLYYAACMSHTATVALTRIDQLAFSILLTKFHKKEHWKRSCMTVIKFAICHTIKLHKNVA